MEKQLCMLYPQEFLKQNQIIMDWIGINKQP
jgi:hypothetical protein